MAKPEWGVKRLCQSCATKFYDLGRSPITCPKCGAAFDPESVLKSRRSRPIAVAKPAPPVAAKAKKPRIKAEDVAIEDEDKTLSDLSEGEEADDAAIEDASELGEEDDMSDVVVGGEDEDD